MKIITNEFNTALRDVLIIKLEARHGSESRRSVIEEKRGDNELLQVAVTTLRYHVRKHNVTPWLCSLFWRKVTELKRRAFNNLIGLAQLPGAGVENLVLNTKIETKYSIPSLPALTCAHSIRRSDQTRPFDS